METAARYQRTPSETEMQRSGRETYESAGGYGQQVSETGTGTEQPSLKERLDSTFTGRPEEQRYQTREYTSETGTGVGAGTGSLGDSMRSTLSSRPSLQSEKRPSMGEQIKGVFTGRSAEEQRAYDMSRERERERGQGRGYETRTGQGRGYETGTGTGRGYETGTGTGRGYEQGRERERGYGTSGTGTGTEQPSFMERVEATFMGRTPQEQHEYDARQRREREYERSRGSSTSQPGLMSQLGGAMTGMSSAVFGGETKKTLGQRMKESLHEIKTNLTGRTGETSYTPMERSSYTHTGSEYPTGTRRSGTGTVY